MKATAEFKKIIQEHLQNRADNDDLFAIRFSNSTKNIDDCITYILNKVKDSGCCGFADDEIFSMAVHYYDEEKIEIDKPISCNVVVNHMVELTEEEKEEARKQAKQKVEEEEYKRMTTGKKAKKKEENNLQPSLF